MDTVGVADKQSMILDLLKSRSSESFTARELERLTGLSIVSSIELLQSLARNEGVSLDSAGRYRAKLRYSARNRHELLELIAREGSDPLRWRELVELYPDAQRDLCDLTRRAEVIRVRSDDMLFSDVVLSRSQLMASLVRVSGRVQVSEGECLVRTDRDLRSEVFRNDVVWVGQPARGLAGLRVYRVSSRSQPRQGSGVPDPEVAPCGVHRPSVQNFNRAHGAAYSAADTLPHALHYSREYVHPFTATHFPLDMPWKGPSSKGLTLYRLGCSGDIRVLWREILHHRVSHKAKEEGGGGAAGGGGGEGQPGGNPGSMGSAGAAAAAAAAAAAVAAAAAASRKGKAPEAAAPTAGKAAAAVPAAAAAVASSSSSAAAAAPPKTAALAASSAAAAAAAAAAPAAGASSSATAGGMEEEGGEEEEEDEYGYEEDEEEGVEGGEGRALEAALGGAEGAPQPKPRKRSRTEGAWDLAGVYAGMGGLTAFQDMPPFPDTHVALRREMEKISMVTRMAPGVLEVEMGAPVVAPQEAAERAKMRKSRGPRALDSRMSELDASTTANLNEETRAKLKAANDAIVMRKLQEAHLNHGEMFKGLM